MTIPLKDVTEPEVELEEPAQWLLVSKDDILDGYCKAPQKRMRTFKREIMGFHPTIFVLFAEVFFLVFARLSGFHCPQIAGSFAGRVSRLGAPSTPGGTHLLSRGQSGPRVRGWLPKT